MNKQETNKNDHMQDWRGTGEMGSRLKQLIVYRALCSNF